MNPNADTPTFNELLLDIAAVALAHYDTPRFNYFHTSFAYIADAHRVNRLDLYELLNAVTDYGRIDLDDVPAIARDAVARLNRVYANMDRAAAFASTDYPLVITNDNDRDYYNYTVLPHDTDVMRDRKHARQRPSALSYREYIAAVGI